MAKRKISAEAKSVEQFLILVRERRDEWLPDDVVEPWFRGQQKAYWPLVPSLYRYVPKDMQTEYEVREEFITRAPIFLDSAIPNEWAWYFLMQHHRAPTRLLDWTENALCALYFAVRDNQGYHDAAVWMLDPWWLNKYVLRLEEVLPPGVLGISRKHITRLDRWLPKRFQKRARLPQYPIAIYPTHVARRISAQRSCFTIHGSEVEGLDKLAKNAKDPGMFKILIPSYCVKQIARELRTCGIDEVTIFPDLQGLGNSLGRKWQTDDLDSPHDNVYTRLGVSKIHGVGVFAIKKIKRGTSIFRGDRDEMVPVDAATLPKSPRQIRKLYTDFGVLKNGRYSCPPNFNCLTLAWYVNHSPNPNVRCDADYDFVALRDIRPGEELTVDYSTYSENPVE